MRTWLRYLRNSAILLVAIWAMLEIMDPGYTRNLLLGLDVFANTALLGEPETISARLGRREKNGDETSSFFCDVLDFFFMEPDHCIKALDEDE